jgi:hypothetical protein
MSPEELRACRERAEAATPGPWVRDLYEDGESGEGPLGVFPGARGEWVESNNVIRPPSAEGDLGDDVATCDRNGDAAFIAHARADVPRLLATVAARDARLEAVADVLSAHGCDCECGCDSDGHGDDCEPCLGCRIEAAMKGASQ